MLAKALYAILVNAEAVTDLVSTRIRPLRLDTHDGFPYVDYATTEEREERHSTGTTGVRFAAVQFTAYATTHLGAAAVDAAVKAALESAPRGAVAGVGEILIIRITSEDATDEPDLGNRGQSGGPYAIGRVYRVKYRVT